MKIRKNEEIKKRQEEILTIAKNIIINEGVDSLSMRNIAKAFQQVPGNLYHYFKNKDEILVALVRREYLEMVSVLGKRNEDDIENQIRDTLTNYINYMVDKFALFDIIRHIKNKQIQEQLYLLTPGISKSRKSITVLCEVLEKGCKETIFKINNIELRAQIIISSTQGVIERLAMEEPEQKEEIIREYVEMILQSLRRKKDA